MLIFNKPHGITLYPNNLAFNYALINSEFTFGIWIIIIARAYSAMYQGKIKSSYELRIEFEYSIDEVRIFICTPTCTLKKFKCH